MFNEDRLERISNLDNLNGHKVNRTCGLCARNNLVAYLVLRYNKSKNIWFLGCEHYGSIDVKKKCRGVASLAKSDKLLIEDIYIREIPREVWKRNEPL